MSDYILRCDGISKRYGKKEVLHEVCFDVPKGRIVGLLGPNGSGKTTIIKMINGLIPVTKGKILIEGQAPGEFSKRTVSYLPDKECLNNWMSVEELIGFYQDFYDDFDSGKAYEMLKNLGILKTDRLKAMSKGTREKVQLILVMSRKAKLYILDEPIGGVDPAAREYILNTILSNYQEDAAVVISTHLISEVETILDDVVFINEGTVVMADSVDHIRETHQKSVDSVFREVFKCW